MTRRSVRRMLSTEMLTCLNSPVLTSFPIIRQASDYAWKSRMFKFLSKFLQRHCFSIHSDHLVVYWWQLERLREVFHLPANLFQLWMTLFFRSIRAVCTLQDLFYYLGGPSFARLQHGAHICCRVHDIQRRKLPSETTRIRRYCSCNSLKKLTLIFLATSLRSLNNAADFT